MMKKKTKINGGTEIENMCIVCHSKIEFPEATIITRSKEKSKITIWEFCSGECLDDFVRTVGGVMLNIESNVLAELNETQLEINNKKVKGGSKNEKPK